MFYSQHGNNNFSGTLQTFHQFRGLPIHWLNARLWTVLTDPGPKAIMVFHLMSKPINCPIKAIEAILRANKIILSSQLCCAVPLDWPPVNHHWIKVLSRQSFAGTAQLPNSTATGQQGLIMRMIEGPTSCTLPPCLMSKALKLLLFCDLWLEYMQENERFAISSSLY